jgi:hypothetical protein
MGFWQQHSESGRSAVEVTDWSQEPPTSPSGSCRGHCNSTVHKANGVCTCTVSYSLRRSSNTLLECRMLRPGVTVARAVIPGRQVKVAACILNTTAGCHKLRQESFADIAAPLHDLTKKMHGLSGTTPIKRLSKS